MAVARLRAAGVLAGLLLLASCGDGDPAALPLDGSSSSSGAASPTGTIPKACDLITFEDASDAIGGPADIRGMNDQEKAASSTDVYCTYAAPYTRLQDQIPAVAIIVGEDREVVAKVQEAEDSFVDPATQENATRIDDLGVLAYRYPSPADNTAIIALFPDDSHAITVIVAMLANADASYAAAHDLSRRVLARL